MSRPSRRTHESPDCIFFKNGISIIGVQKVSSILAVLVLLVTLVPVGLNATVNPLACCNGIMCPMHAAQYHGDCGTDTNRSGTAVMPCALPAPPRYTTATVFVLPSPVVLNRTVVTEPAVVSLQRLLLDVETNVEPPPPRLQRIA